MLSARIMVGLARHHSEQLFQLGPLGEALVGDVVELPHSEADVAEEQERLQHLDARKGSGVESEHGDADAAVDDDDQVDPDLQDATCAAGRAFGPLA